MPNVQCPMFHAPSMRRGRTPIIGNWSLVILTTALLLATVAPASAAPLLSTNLPPVSAALPDAGFSVIRVFGALVLVLGLFLGGVWLFKNWQRVALNRGRPSQLQVIEMKSLGGRHALYVVGYQHQRLLLASSPTGVALVSHLPSEETDSLPASQPAAGENFVQALQQAVQARP